MKLEPFSPEWIAWQGPLRRSDPHFQSKVRLVRDYAEHLERRGERITYERMRAMLESMNRGYGLSRQEIHWGLYLSKVRAKMPLRPNGKRVRVGDNTYRSIRAAARGEGCRQSTVVKRVEAGEPGWSFVDD
jgi:hypothetical protein